MCASSQVTVTSASLGTQHFESLSYQQAVFSSKYITGLLSETILTITDTVAVLRTMDFQREKRRETLEEMPLNLALIIRLNLENLGKMPDTQKELGEVPFP